MINGAMIGSEAHRADRTLLWWVVILGQWETDTVRTFPRDSCCLDLFFFCWTAFYRQGQVTASWDNTWKISADGAKHFCKLKKIEKWHVTIIKEGCIFIYYFLLFLCAARRLLKSPGNREGRVSTCHNLILFQKRIYFQCINKGASFCFFS